MAEEAFASARQELDVARVAGAGDARLVWAEVNLLFQRAGIDHLSEEEAVRKAEQLVRAAAKAGTPESTVPLVRWLIFRKRLNEAEETLGGLEKGQPSQQLQLLRAQIAAARGLTSEEAEEIERLGELLNAKGSWVDDPCLIGSGAALAGYEKAGLQHYLGGVKAGVDYRQAIQDYEKALPYARFHGPARAGIAMQSAQLCGPLPQRGRQPGCRASEAARGADFTSCHRRCRNSPGRARRRGSRDEGSGRAAEEATSRRSNWPLSVGPGSPVGGQARSSSSGPGTRSHGEPGAWSFAGIGRTAGSGRRGLERPPSLRPRARRAAAGPGGLLRLAGNGDGLPGQGHRGQTIVRKFDPQEPRAAGWVCGAGGHPGAKS